MALFITFEGGDGCGKSTQARRLYNRLRKNNIPTLLTHEPGYTIIGKRIARLLKWTPGLRPSPLTELMLFNASRSQLVSEVILPNLKMGRVILCDRYADSTVAYQSYGRGLDQDLVNLVNDIATQGAKPDLTILLNISAEEGMARKYGSKRDRFEREDISFHHRVHDGYLALAANEPERWLVIEADQPIKRIAGIIWHRITRLLDIKGIQPADG